MNADPLDQTVPGATKPTVGQILRSMREANGCSIEQLASLTRLRPERILALEEDDFRRVPYRAFTVGHIRVYARELGQDPTAALEALVAQHGPQLDQSEKERFGTTRNRPAWLSAPALALAVALVILAAFLVLRATTGGELATVETTATPSTAPIVPAFTSSETEVVAPLISVKVAASEPTLLEAIVDGQTAFSDFVAAGEIHSWTGTESLRIKSDNVGALEIEVDGEVVIQPGSGDQELDRTWFAGN